MNGNLFDGNFSESHFEAQSRENGFTYWYASDLAFFLEYANLDSFMNPINKAVGVCTTLKIPVFENFVQVKRNGKTDFKLSRFACYLVVMNADVKKNSVAKAQAYFANLAGVVQDYMNEVERIERLEVREEISQHEKSISATVHNAGIKNYAFFQNAGYRGLYNMNISKLKKRRDIPSKRSLLDFMGSNELAANLFRITQTKLRIQNQKVKGQKNLENTAEKVGRMVRKSIQEISGTNPENLPKSEDLKEVKKDLKKKSREIKKIDKKN